MVETPPPISQLSMDSPASTSSEEEPSNDDSDGPDAAQQSQNEKDLDSDSKEDIIPPTPMKTAQHCSRGSKQTKLDSSDKDDDEYPMAADYFQEKNPRTNLAQVDGTLLQILVYTRCQFP